MAGVGFVYCRYLDKCTARGVLCTFVRQLLEAFPQTVLPFLMPWYNESTTRQTTLTLHEARDILGRLLPMFQSGDGGGIEVVIDGLDEVSDDEKTELLETLAELPGIKILIFSRPLTMFAEMLGTGVKEVTIKATSGDIELFITSRLRSTPRLRRLLRDNEALMEEMFKKIGAKSGGMFLMAALQFEAIRGCTSPKTLTEALKSLPVGISDMYLRTLERIKETMNKHEVDLAFQALMWVTHAKEPLTIHQLQLLLATSYEEGSFDFNAITPAETILSVCGGLLVCGSDNATASLDAISPRSEVRLIHFTAQEHFSRLNNIPPFSMHPVHITLTLVTYLKHWGYHRTTSSLSSMQFHTQEREWKAYYTLLERIHLGVYAHWHLGRHARELGEHAYRFPSAEASDALNAFADFLCECKHLFLEGLYFDRVDPYSYAASHGLIQLLPRLKHLHRPSMGGLSALQIAVKRGHKLNAQMVEVLLADSDIDVNQRDLTGRSVLHLAALLSHREDPGNEMVRLLLTHPQIDVNLLDDVSKSPLVVASEKKRRGVVDLLLQHPNINVTIPPESRDSSRSIYLSTLLANATRSADEDDDCHSEASPQSETCPAPELVNKLMPYTGETPLHLALESKSEPERQTLVQSLLAHPRILPNIHNCYGDSPLTAAVKKSDIAICRLLLAHPLVDVNMPDHRGRTPLILACGAVMSDECDELIRLILCHPEVNVNLAFNGSKTALETATDSHRTAIVDLILEHPTINDDVPDQPPHNSLAAQEVLARIAASPRAINSVAPYTGNTLLHDALDFEEEFDRVSVVRRLLDRPGIRPNVRNCYGLTPLAKAVKQGDVTICRLLASHSLVDVNLADVMGNTPLMLACAVEEADLEIVELLASHAAVSLDARNRRGENCIMIATRSRFGAASDLLEERMGVVDREWVSVRHNEEETSDETVSIP